jgi:hypothetical protein
MIVELLDYRPQQRNKEASLDKPEKTRVVLHPNGETLFADICSLNRKNGSKWTDRDALEVEARLLVGRDFSRSFASFSISNSSRRLRHCASLRIHTSRVSLITF